jgi:hypothetical protein
VTFFPREGQEERSCWNTLKLQILYKIVTEMHEVCIFEVLDIGISSKAMPILNSFISGIVKQRRVNPGNARVYPEKQVTPGNPLGPRDKTSSVTHVVDPGDRVSYPWRHLAVIS